MATLGMIRVMVGIMTIARMSMPMFGSHLGGMLQPVQFPRKIESWTHEDAKRQQHQQASAQQCYDRGMKEWHVVSLLG